MKKIISIILITTLLALPFANMADVKAETLRDLRDKLEKQRQDYQNNQNEQKLTQEQIDTVNQQVKSIQTEIQNIYTDISNTEQAIEKLNVSIAEKEQEIRDIINFVQISNGESAYLEYAFGAKDFTDFIYRMAISEQLTNYNKKLIEEYNQMIEDNKQKKIDLQNKQVELGVKQEQLNKKYDELKGQLNEILEVSVSIEAEMKYQEELINLYVEKGCGEDEDIRVCGRSYLPRDTAFWRPLERGYVTSEYGYRGAVAGTQAADFHDGIDMSTSPANNIPVYAAANGMVSGMFRYEECGGNMLFIHHIINGQSYTTGYYHLLKILVNQGDMVTKNTVIGIMGGGPLTPWDRCSTAAHTHFSIATGLYGIDYKGNYSNFVAHTFNPRMMLNVPTAHYSWFTDRLTKY